MRSYAKRRIASSVARSRLQANSLHRFTSRSQQIENLRAYYPQDPNLGISYELPQGQDLSLYLSLEDAIGAGIVRTTVDGAVGAGLSLESAVDYETIGITKEEANRTSRRIEKLWKLWASEPDACDALGKENFGELNRIAAFSACATGDILQNIKIGKWGGVYVPQIALIDGRLVKNEDGAQDTKTIAGGVEIDSEGRETAYHIDVVGDDLLSKENKRVSRKTSGYKRLKYNLVTIGKIQPGQRRGRPVVFPVIDTIIQAKRFNEVSLVKAIVQTNLSVFIQEKAGEDLPPDYDSDTKSVLAALGQTSPDKNGEERQEKGEPITMAPGAIIKLPPGQEAILPESKAPVAEFWAFMEGQLKFVGMGTGIPYEVLLKAFNSNYSASQAAIQDAARGWDIWRRRWASQFCQPVYDQFVDLLVEQNIISCPGFYDSPFIRRAWLQANWFGPAVLNIDPVKNAKAKKLMIDEHLTTREAATRELSGQSYDDVISRREFEEKDIKSRGLETGGPQTWQFYEDEKEEKEDE